MYIFFLMHVYCVFVTILGPHTVHLLLLLLLDQNLHRETSDTDNFLDVNEKLKIPSDVLHKSKHHLCWPWFYHLGNQVVGSFFGQEDQSHGRSNPSLQTHCQTLNWGCCCSSPGWTSYTCTEGWSPRCRDWFWVCLRPSPLCYFLSFSLHLPAYCPIQ